MEDTVALTFFGIHALIWVTILAILVYLIFRRVRIKKEETFENRDN